jgi:hypothetical protein
MAPRFFGGGVIHGRYDFTAENDAVATVTAGLLFEACSDRCHTFELWRGKELVSPCAERAVSEAPKTIGEVIETKQAELRHHEELIRDSNWTIAQSKLLLTRIRQLEDEGVLAHDHEGDMARGRRLRMKAEELRVVAEQMANPTRQSYYRRLAANYEALADHERSDAAEGRGATELTQRLHADRG